MENQRRKTTTSIDGRWKANMVLAAVCLMAFPLWLHQALGQNEITGCVVIDPGHGGIDPGTRGSNGMDEKNIVLAVAKDMIPLLKRNHIKFILTRSRDKYVSLSHRVQIANRPGDRLLLSLHCDYFKQRGMEGFTVLYAKGASHDSRIAAHQIAKGLVHKGFTCHDVRMDTRGLEVLDNSNCSAVLVELGFMSDPHDVRYLTSQAGQHRLAAGLVRGLTMFLHHTR